MIEELRSHLKGVWKKVPEAPSEKPPSGEYLKAVELAVQNSREILKPVWEEQRGETLNAILEDEFFKQEHHFPAEYAEFLPKTPIKTRLWQLWYGDLKKRERGYNL